MRRTLHEAIRPTYVDHTPDSVKAYLTKEQFNRTC